MDLNGLYLDKTSPMPLYEQLRQALLEAITNGKIPEGAKLPTEEECVSGWEFPDRWHVRRTVL